MLGQHSIDEANIGGKPSQNEPWSAMELNVNDQKGYLYNLASRQQWYTVHTGLWKNYLSCNSISKSVQT